MLAIDHALGRRGFAPRLGRLRGSLFRNQVDRRQKAGSLRHGRHGACRRLLAAMLAAGLVAIRLTLLVGGLALADGRERTHVLAARTLAVPASLVPARIDAAVCGLGALGGLGRTGRLACGHGNGRGTGRALLLSLATARPLRPPRIARISRPGNGRLFAAVGVVHVTAYGAAQSLKLQAGALSIFVGATLPAPGPFAKFFLCRSHDGAPANRPA